MYNDEGTVFYDYLKHNFSPMLRSEGFKGSGQNFRRINGDAIHVLNIRASKYGGECCVNMSVHYAFLPTEINEPVADPHVLKHYSCAFRYRLREAGLPDQWWRYGRYDAESESNAEDLIQIYRRFGVWYFQQFEPFPDVFEKITPAELDAGDVSNLPPMRTTLVRTALTMARIMKHLRQFEKCKQFAEVGLRHIGSAIRLVPEFETLKRADA